MTRKLKLNLEALEVETFETADTAQDGGTVEAFITGICDDTEGLCTGKQSCLALCSAQCEPQSIPCTVQALTCPPPSAQTCATACNSGCNTCHSCQDTCWQTCGQYCNGTCDFQTQCW